MPIKFSEEELMKMENMYKDTSFSYEDIAKELNCSKITIEKRARRHGWNDVEIIKKRIDIHYRPNFKINTSGFAKHNENASKKSKKKWQNINEANKKICYACNKVKTLKKFYKLNDNHQIFLSDGIIKYNPYCNTCERERVAKNKEIKNSTLDGRLEVLMHGVKRRSRDKNKKYNISKNTLMQLWGKQRGKCYYSGIDMSHKANDIHTASVDRLNPKKWYDVKNVVLCCWVINNMKQDLSEKEFIKRIKTLYKSLCL